MTRWDIAFEIAGEVTSADVLRGLAATAVREGASPDWLELHDEEDAEEAIIGFAESGKRVCFVKPEASEGFPLLAAFCRDHGLTYRASFGTPGEDGYEIATVWQPGMTQEVTFDLDDAGRPTVPSSDLAAAAADGEHAVSQLVEKANAVFSAVDRIPLSLAEGIVATEKPTTRDLKSPKVGTP